MSSGDREVLSPWRWLRRACGYGPLVGMLAALVAMPSWAPLVMFFSLFLAVPFGLACRLLIGSEPAGGGLVVVAGVLPFVFLNLVTVSAGPLEDGVGLRVFFLSVLATVGCSTVAAILVRRDEQRIRSF